MILTNQDGKAIEDIAEMWQKFFAEGIYNKSEVNKESKNSENRVIKIIPEGKYASFIITGDVQKSFGEAWSKIWNMDLKRKYTCDFEEYQNSTEDMNNQEIHIYIAIED